MNVNQTKHRTDKLEQLYTINQCFGSASFKCGSGSADLLPWVVDKDPTNPNSNFCSGTLNKY